MANKPTPAFMIDERTTVDRDDAIRLETAADGTRTLTVYIADLTPALDAAPGLLAAALANGATQYRRHRAVAPMLPPDVEAAHSLSEGEARPALLVHATIRPDGLPGQATFSRGQLTDGVVLTHEQAARAVSSRRDRHHEAMCALRTVAENLFRARYGSSCAFYDLARGVYVDEDGALVKVASAHVVGHLIVQEAMIWANRAFAEQAARRDIPIMYRNHLPAASEPPAAVRLDDLSSALRSQDEGLLRMWMERAALTGRRARYEACLRGHHGLSATAYTHATSPLRRAADLVTQRAFVAHLEQRPAPFTAQELEGLCDRLTVVLAESAAAASEAHRDRAHRIAREILGQDDRGGEGNYASMGPAAFFALVKRATKEGISSSGFLAEVVRRAQAGRLELRDLYHLLMLPTGPVWTGAKQACLGQIARRPADAVSVLAMYAHTRGLPPPHYAIETRGATNEAVFTATGTLTRPDGSHVTGAARKAPSKARAQAQAAVSLLATFAEIEDPSADSIPATTPTPPRRTQSPAERGEYDAAFATLNHLHSLRRLTGLEWSITASADGHVLQFHARLTARDEHGRALEGEGRATTKQHARARAAAELLNQLSPAVPTPDARGLLRAGDIDAARANRARVG